MNFYATILAIATLTACAQQPTVQPYCGQPNEIWIPAENIDEPHALIHSIKITHANQILVNGNLLSKAQLAKFLKDESAPTLLPFIYFDFDAHSSCKVVAESRSMIEKSGICRDQNCVTGNDEEVPPPPDGNEDDKAL
jgi:hypothetical protein